MKKLAVAVGIVLVASLAACVDAQQSRREFRRMNWDENLPEAVRTFHDKRFSVVSFRTSFEVPLPTPGGAQHVEAIRAAARSNTWLVGQLKAKSITPDEIEWVEKARNGSMIFYVE